MIKWIGLISFIALSVGAIEASRIAKPDDGFKKTFKVNVKNLRPTGVNDYFILKPGRKLEYEGGDTHLVMTVLNKTKVIDGVTTRVVEERETKGGNLVEISLNFLAIDEATRDIYYFGEDVDNYKNGKIVNHESAWRSGVKKAKFGLFIPGSPKVGDSFYQELAPGAAMDRIKIVSLEESIKTTAGTFKKCMKFEETTPLEPGAKDYKLFAPGVGMVQDGELLLVKKS